MVKSDNARQSYRKSCAYYKAAFASCLILSAIGLPLIFTGLAGDSAVVFLHSNWSQSDLSDAFGPVTEEAIAEGRNIEQELLDKLRSLDGPDSETVHEVGGNWQVVRMKVTAYCPCRICCGKHSDGITANNHRIRSGDVFVAADKKVPFGTAMIIPGYNHDMPVEVMDRGRLIKGNRLDVFMHSHREAQKWGCRELDVFVKID